MTLTQQIASHIRQARILGDAHGVSDFQLRVTKKGAVLFNLRTHRGELLFDQDEYPFLETESIAQ
jgi:hypothetical protein